MLLTGQLNVSHNERPNSDDHTQYLSNETLDTLIRIFRLHVPVVISILGIIGNFLAFLTMNAKSKRHSVVAWNFKALAIADTLAIIVIIIQWVIFENAFAYIRPWGRMFCKQYFFFGYCSYGIALWSVASLTVDRVIAVCLPLQASVWCTLRKAKLLFLCSILAHFVMYIYYWLLDFNTNSSTTNHYEVCIYPEYFPSWFSAFAQLQYQVVDIVCTSFVIVVGNICIGVRLYNRQRERRHLGVANREAKHYENKLDSGIQELETKPNGNVDNSWEAMRNRGLTESSKRKEDGGILLMLFTVSLVFIFTQLTYCIDWVYWEFVNPAMARREPRIRAFTFNLGMAITTVNNSINFYLYLLSSASFRRDFRQICRSCKILNGVLVRSFRCWTSPVRGIRY